MPPPSDDEFFSAEKMNKQLQDSIEQSKELTRRSQEILDGRGRTQPPHGDEGQAA